MNGDLTQRRNGKSSSRKSGERGQVSLKQKKAGEESPAVEAYFSTQFTVRQLLRSVKQNFQTVVAQFPVGPLCVQVEPDTVHFLSKVSDLFASQRICVSLWLCGGFYFFRLGATPLGTVPSNFRMSPFLPTAQPRCASAKPIVLVCSSFICSQFFPRSIE